ncbi:Suppressor protein stp22 of temperature-sensitive alpha-factor receptor and arginine permease [Collariella sp. IMI 366227]|nr:Suppressor protein stp22 of temperature-sensitive alpha-factor receptor and arginine permease [Collariella sp. IMI 366227]
MVVQQHVLNWLYSVLTSEYHDVNRTYNDVAQALSQYPSLAPKTDVHTFANGASALLLHLSGTIPVLFRGTTYRFPISIWVPHAYPREAPLVYVTPTETMMVRPAQHVDPQGQVYHPYLVGWSTFWDPKPPPPPDLMDDDLTLAIPSPSNVPPPPIPPNPEKDLLLHRLAQTLHTLREKSRAQNDASLQGLHAQHTAMLQAMTTLQAESAQLTQLSALLTSNTAILQDSLRKADQVIESSASHPKPDIDELLVAPTVVGNQLYELVAEERALADAIFMLGRAVERGRIAPQTFAKMTRGVGEGVVLEEGACEEDWKGDGVD